MAVKQPNRPKEIARLQALVEGATKHFAGATQLAFGGATTTLVALIALFQGLIAQLVGVNTARADLQAKLQSLRGQAPAARATARAFTAFVRATFGNQPDVLVDFELAPRKAPAPRSAAQKKAAAEKAKATRLARGTKGPKQKAQIHGQPPEAAPAVEAAAGNVAPPAAGTK